MTMCKGAVKERVACVEEPGCVCAREATDIEVAGWESWGPATGGVGVLTPGEGPRNMESIVGRSAAPNGVERKSLGKSSTARE